MHWCNNVHRHERREGGERERGTYEKRLGSGEREREGMCRPGVEEGIKKACLSRPLVFGTGERTCQSGGNCGGQERAEWGAA